MQITCLVLDDDPAYVTLVAAMMAGYKDLVLAGAYTLQEDVIAHLCREPVDLLFADMEMPGLSGIEFVRSLPDPPLVVFITSHPEMALESFEIGTVDYLVKPLNKFRFKKAIEKVTAILETKKKADLAEKLMEGQIQQQDYFMIRSDSQYVKIKYNDVLYIEAMADFVKIHLPGRTEVALSTMKSIENLIPNHIFMRTHRSYIVNITHVDALSGSGIMINGREIPVGESFKDAVLERIVGNKLLKR